ncbi:hypothetical protein [Wolbachia endosymbiont of Tetranychus urticae]|uniref:hypothetical protein n=1 Tax=Wolbachia endosymbiont of Tetranychus urticae TaxID=169184 RepID=UPI003977E779
MSNYISRQTRVIKDELQTTGRVRANDDQSVENVKITNDHAFYKLICEKQAHGDVSTEQFNSLYYDISEKMIRKPFTIQEINNFCKEKGIPLFEINELLTLVPKDETKCYADYEVNSVRGHDHGYMADQINIKASYIEKSSIDHPDYQNYIVDSDSYYKFIYKKLILETLRDRALDMFNGGKTEEQVREYLNRINTSNKTVKEVKELLENTPEGSLKKWLDDPLNKGYTDVEYHVLYEKISEELVHTSMSVDQIKGIYNQYGITPPIESELEGMKKVQEETRSSEHYEQKTGLKFQGRINLNVTDDSAENKFNLNIDLFQDKSFEDLIDQNNDGVINNEGLLKALEDTVKTFNKVFGIKKDNNPLLAHGNVANFRLFLFKNKESYEDCLSKGYSGKIPGGGAAESSDNNYISNMYSHAENGRNNGDFTHDGKMDHNDYNYVVKHELVHALTFYLTSKLDLGTVLMEGLAEYVTHLTQGKKLADFAKLVGEKYKEHTLEEIIKGAIDPYETGAAAIAYIEETYPNFIDNLLYAATEDRKTLNGRFYFKEMMTKIYESEGEKIKNGKGFSNWVKANSSTEDSAVKSHHIQYDQQDEENEVHSKEQVNEDRATTASFRGLEVPKKPVMHAQNEEKIILKDTILKIEKNYDRDVEGKHKANVTIDYNDVKALYNRAEGEDKSSVLKFWNKLHTSDYKIGTLPEEKYYFKDGKFVVHDSDTTKLIVLPEDKVSMKIMKDGNSYSLAISNGNGKVISSISKIDNPNYELLSDSRHFSLETQDNFELLDQHHEYDLYLENGFVKMFDCASDHVYHDHNSAYI